MHNACLIKPDPWWRAQLTTKVLPRHVARQSVCLIVRRQPVAMWDSCESNGRALLQRQPADMWYVTHHHDWIKDVRVVGGSRACQFIRLTILSWLDKYSRFDEKAWRYGAAAQRLSNWLCHYSFFGNSADVRFLNCFGKALARHAGYLSSALRAMPHGLEQLLCLKALLLVGVSCEDQQGGLQDILKQIEHNLQAWQDNDWAVQHLEDMVLQLETMLDMRGNLRNVGVGVPHVLTSSIHMLAAQLSDMGADGIYPMFSGGVQRSSGYMQNLLNVAIPAKACALKQQIKPQVLALHKPSTDIYLSALPQEGHPQLSTLALEVIDKAGQRIISQCGYPMGGKWQNVLSQSVATSSISVDDKPPIDCRRQALTTIDAVQTGNAIAVSVASFHGMAGLNVVRTVSSNQSGTIITGVDDIDGGSGQQVCLRFHTSKDVQVQERLRIVMADDTVWQMETNASTVSIMDSVQVVGDDIVPIKQIVLLQRLTQYRQQIKWQLRKL